jgi:hypothetical protein
MNLRSECFAPPTEKNLLSLSTIGAKSLTDRYAKSCYLTKVYSEIKDQISQNLFIKKIYLSNYEFLYYPLDVLLAIFESIHRNNPNIEEINMLASNGAILQKTTSELKKLQKYGLGTLYQITFSGYEESLKDFNHNESLPENQLKSANKIHHAKIKLGEILFLGDEGDCFEEHACEMANKISEMHPASISLIIKNNSAYLQLFKKRKINKSEYLTNLKLISEIKIFIDNLKLKNCLMFSNRALNNLSLRVSMSEQKNYVIALLDEIIEKQRVVLH